MRVPIPIVILLCFAAMLITWWLGTKNKDFLTAPASTEFASESSPPTAPTTSDSARTTDSNQQPAPEETPVPLDTFADQAAMGPAHLIELAKSMEKAKWPHLARLAWERVIDGTSASADEVDDALAAIEFLRADPASSQRTILPDAPYIITIHAGTAEKLADEIETVMTTYAQAIHGAAQGILEVRIQVARGQNPEEATDFTPVAIWITGPDARSQSSEVVSFTTTPEKNTEQQLQTTLTRLLRNLVAKNLIKPPAAPKRLTLESEFACCFTRLAWHTLGQWMNTPIEDEESITPAILAPQTE